MNGGKVFQPHYSNASNPRAIQKRQALRQALLELLDRKPFDDITIPDITKAAGVGYTTFYRHYPGKDELLDDVAQEEINKLLKMVIPLLGTGQDEQSRMATALAFCGYINEHRASWATLLTGGAAGKLRDEFIRISQQIQLPRPPEQSEPWLPVDVASIFGVSGTIELLAWWLRQKDPIPVEAFADIYKHLVITPLCSEKQV